MNLFSRNLDLKPASSRLKTCYIQSSYKNLASPAGLLYDILDDLSKGQLARLYIASCQNGTGDDLELAKQIQQLGISSASRVIWKPLASYTFMYSQLLDWAPLRGRFWEPRRLVERDSNERDSNERDSNERDLSENAQAKMHNASKYFC